jgi:REP element-mobilizing transposase RayT
VIAELVFAEQHALAVSLAWAVMPDHLHWMFVLRTPSLSRLVQRVKSRSARHINALGSTMGMIWQPGFYDHQVRFIEDLATQARYILANPVRRGLAERIGEYPHAWCQYVADEHDL